MPTVKAVTPKWDALLLINGVTIDTWQADQISLFVSRRPYGAKRDIIFYRVDVPDNEWTTEFDTPFDLKPGLRLWVESKYPCRTRYSAVASRD